MIRGEKSGLPHEIKTSAYRLDVMTNFLRCRRRQQFWIGVITKELVMCGDDVLDCGAVLCFLQRQGIDENGLIRDRGGQSFEFCQLPAGRRGFLQHGRRFENLGCEATQRLERSRLRLWSHAWSGDARRVCETVSRYTYRW